MSKFRWRRFRIGSLITLVLSAIFIVAIYIKVHGNYDKDASKSIHNANSQIDWKLIEGIRKDYAFAEPTINDFRKLTGDTLKLESSTDPLRISVTCNEKVYLLLLVASRVENYERRKLIRDTWKFGYEETFLNIKNSRNFQNDQHFSIQNVVKVVFILGQSKKGGNSMEEIYEEQNVNKDLVLGSFQEDYRNLTLKTRLALKWSYYECRSVYTIKTDDDVFVNTAVFVEWLKSQPKEKLYAGYCTVNSPVIRDKNSKWYFVCLFVCFTASRFVHNHIFRK